MGVIVTITTGGPVAMETGGSGGWLGDEREDTHTFRDINIYKHIVFTHAKRKKMHKHKE